MYKHILVPVDLSDPDLAKPAVDTAVDAGQGLGRHRCGWSMCCR